MSSKNSISRIVITLACAFVALFEVLNLLDVFKHIKYYPFLDLIVAIVIPLALIGFCALAILKGDNKDTLVALALTAYAGINSAWIFIKACEALANGWFSIDYILNISFYLVLLLHFLYRERSCNKVATAKVNDNSYVHERCARHGKV